MTCDEILRAMERDRTNLLTVLEGLPEEVLTTERVTDRWTIKDLLGHMAMWKKVAVQFLDDYAKDGVAKTLGLDNDAAVEAHNLHEADRRSPWSLAQVRAELDEAHTALVTKVHRLSEQDLTTPLQGPWHGATNLEHLIAINSYTHDPDHIEQIKQWRELHAR